MADASDNMRTKTIRYQVEGSRDCYLTYKCESYLDYGTVLDSKTDGYNKFGTN